MKIAQLFILVKLPDDFDGTADEILEYITARPAGRPHPDAPPPNTPHNGNPSKTLKLMNKLREEAWPLLLSSIAYGRVCVIAVNRYERNEDGTLVDEHVRFPATEVTP